MNYTSEMTEKLIEKYRSSPTMETVEELAKEFGKPKKSIIGKLSREGVYRRQTYTGKTGEVPVTKNELVTEIAEYLGLGELEGLEKAPKNTLKRMLGAIKRE